jgi:hypothetical protein
MNASTSQRSSLQERTPWTLNDQITERECAIQRSKLCPGTSKLSETTDYLRRLQGLQNSFLLAGTFETTRFYLWSPAHSFPGSLQLPYTSESFCASIVR